MNGDADMSKNNTLSKKKYLTENILFALLLAFCFRATLFKNIPSLSYTTSNAIFGIIFISLLSINILTTWNKRRSFFNVYCNTSTALGVYIFISYIYIYPILWVVIAICFILSIAYSLLILTQQIKCRRNLKNIIKQINSLCIWLKNYFWTGLYSNNPYSIVNILF